MRCPGDVVSLLFGFACHPSASFALRPNSEPRLVIPAARFNSRGGCVRARPEGVFIRTRDRRVGFMPRHLSRFPSTPTASAAAAQNVDGVEAQVTPLFECNEAVSCFRNADAGSEIWLVGCYHRGKPSVELVERVIGTVKPRVVMMELDAHRVGLLPEGEARKGEDGLCWWTSDKRTSDVQRAVVGKRKPDSSGERGEQGVEFRTAAVAAQACGARVLLGDRNLEEILRRQAEAKSADEKQATKPSNKRRRAGLDMEKLERLIARRSALGQEVPVTREIMRKWSSAMKRLRPREHAVNVTERDEVMAKNLIKLKDDITSVVAVVGFGHLDGIEVILEAEGWKPVRGRLPRLPPEHAGKVGADAHIINQ